MYQLIKKYLYPFVSVFALVALAAGLFTFATPAFASTGAPATPPTAADKDLMARYQSELARLVTQQANLDKTAAVITKVQALIAKANAAGEDTTALVAAL